jgi:hypothetical protein
MLAIVGLSLSRTGLLAFGLALLWYLWVHKLPRSVGVTLIVGAVVGVLLLPSTIQSLGPFALHSSSDQLRALIDHASAQDVASHFVTGTGPGTAYIQIVNGAQFFFHNSYYAMLAEFGLLVSIPFLLLIVTTTFGLFRTRPRAPAIEAALLASLIMALTLGEVLLTFTMAIILGAAWHHISSHSSPMRVGARGSRSMVPMTQSMERSSLPLLQRSGTVEVRTPRRVP